MDLIIIGKFIQECRKSKKLTQVQLAHKLNVSEKTISKWECGNGFPDTTLMLPLCKELGITANELLSGKKLNNEKDYKDQAETNIINLKKIQEKTTKFLWTLEWIIAIFSCIILYSFISIAHLANMPIALKVLVSVFGFALALTGFHFCLVIEKDIGFYQCPHCQHKYIPTYNQIFLSRHFGRTRMMKCPSCNKKGWAKKTIK